MNNNPNNNRTGRTEPPPSRQTREIGRVLNREQPRPVERDKNATREFSKVDPRARAVPRRPQNPPHTEQNYDEYSPRYAERYDRTEHVTRSTGYTDTSARTVGRQTVSRRKRGGMGKIAAVWIAVLAVILLVILIVAGLNGDKEPKDGPVGSSTASNTTVATTASETTEGTTTVHIDPSEYTEQTKNFSAAYDFTNGILIDLETNKVLASRGGDARIYPASMTKLMTLIVAVESVEDLDEKFTMTAQITDQLYLANASVAGFLVGEEITVRDLIYALILPSGGDGALGLAHHIAGGEEAFAVLMNAKAAQMGLKNTHFTNCTGLHDADHYSTCHEIAMILEYAIKDPFMKEVLTTYRHTSEPTPEHPDGLLMTSTLLSRMNGDESEYMFVQGGKTGYTLEARNCLASFATPLLPGMSEEELKLQPPKFVLVTVGSGEKLGPAMDAIDIYREFSEPEEPEVTEVTVDSPGPSDPDTPSTGDGGDDPIKIYTAKPPTVY